MKKFIDIYNEIINLNQYKTIYKLAASTLLDLSLSYTDKSSGSPVSDYDPNSGKSPYEYITNKLLKSKLIINNTIEDINNNILDAAYKTVIEALKNKNKLFVESINYVLKYINPFDDLIISYTNVLYNSIINELKTEDVEDGLYVLIVNDDGTFEIQNKKDPETEFTEKDYKNVDNWIVTNHNKWIPLARKAGGNRLSIDDNKLNQFNNQLLYTKLGITNVNISKVKKCYTAIKDMSHFIELRNTLKKLNDKDYLLDDKKLKLKEDFAKALLCFIAIDITYMPTKQQIETYNKAVKLKAEKTAAELQKTKKLLNTPMLALYIYKHGIIIPNLNKDKKIISFAEDNKGTGIIYPATAEEITNQYKYIRFSNNESWTLLTTIRTLINGLYQFYDDFIYDNDFNNKLSDGTGDDDDQTFDWQENSDRGDWLYVKPWKEITAELGRDWASSWAVPLNVINVSKSLGYENLSFNNKFLKLKYLILQIQEKLKSQYNGDDDKKTLKKNIEQFIKDCKGTHKITFDETSLPTVALINADDSSKASLFFYSLHNNAENNMKNIYEFK